MSWDTSEQTPLGSILKACQRLQQLEPNDPQEVEDWLREIDSELWNMIDDIEHGEI